MLVRPFTVSAVGWLAALAASQPATAEEATTRIVIERFAFDPSEIRVRAGTRIEFLNNDQAPHGVVGESAAGEIFRSAEQIDEGQTYSVALTAPGDVAFHCGLHANMKGRITVTQ